MSTLLQIAQLGNPVLRQVCQPVSDIGSNWFESFLDNLFATMVEANGAGLAAPQVYEPIRAFVVSCKPNPRYPQAPDLGTFEVINPRIIEQSSEQSKDWEGCLSIPGYRGLVPRPDWISVEFFTRENTLRSIRLEQFAARVFMHEFDHLEGTVYLDRMESTRELVTDREWARLLSAGK